MSYLELKKYIEINNLIIDTLKEQGYNTFFNNEVRVNEILSSAKRKNKLNNYLINENNFDDAVCRYSGLDLKSNLIVNFNLYPKKENTIKQIFIYEVLESQYATKQSYEYFKNNVL
jgi:hypothetical protein